MEHKDPPFVERGEREFREIVSFPVCRFSGHRAECFPLKNKDIFEYFDSKTNSVSVAKNYMHIYSGKHIRQRVENRKVRALGPTKTHKLT